MTERKRNCILAVLPALVCLIGITSVSVFWMQEYQQAEWEHISRFCEILTEENPEDELRVFLAVKTYRSLTEQERRGSRVLAEYGYRSSEFDTGIPWRFLVPSVTLFLVACSVFYLSMWYVERYKRLRIAELTEYLEQVNISAAGTVIQRKEDAFSHLQDEIYKTVTSLYQTREAAVLAKHNFADNLANIAHQMKTPITAALLSVRLGREAFGDNKETPSGYPWMPFGDNKETVVFYFEQVEKQLNRLCSLEESLLLLSRVDAGTLQMDCSQVDLYTVLTLAAENLEDLLCKRSISVDIPDQGCIAFYGDMEWTMEALMNLMKNCMEHSEPGGMIHGRYSVNPLYTEILIWDEGKGFLEEDIPHLFERFYRGKEAVGSGMGIGLALAKSIFELQNGSIAARNRPEGGACFEIRIYGCH